MNDKKTVLIVGAGLSGLVCGMRLSKAGFDVQIVEELTYPGGLLASSRIGKEYLELLPHHLRKTDRALLSLVKEEGLDIEWFDSLWYGRASRRKVGYFSGGFASLINILIQDITDNGGRISYSTTVSEIAECEDGESRYATSCVLNDSGSIVIRSDYVIFTGSCRSFVNCSHGLPIPINFRDQLMNITYKASISIMMVLKRCPSEVYFQRLDETTPFNRIVNHSNVFGVRSYGGNIVYLVGTCSISDALWIASDEEIMEKYFSAFHKMYPVIKKSDIKSWRLTKNRYSVSERYPDQPLSRPAENMYICASGLTKYATHETPENRMDEIVALANEISKEIIKSADRDQDEENPSIVTPIAEGMII
jgi:protoporphyrinogen oxidase